jgi:PAS domain S-box-containing protein
MSAAHRPGPLPPLQNVEQFVDVCPVAIANTDTRHRIRYCNPAFEDLFRCRGGEALGRKLETVVGFDEVPSALRRVPGKRVHLTTRALRSDETSIDLDIHLIPATRTGRFAGFWGTFHDVTPLRHAQALLSKATQTMIEAQERERFRIAKDLHDDVAQRLTVLQINIERLKTDVPSARAALQAQLEKLQTEAKGISASVRALSLDVDVPNVGLIAIDKVLERLCDDVAAQRGIRIHFSSSHVPRSVRQDVSLALFRVAQEAVNLPERSGVRAVRITLTGTTGMIRLDIRDLGSARIDESDAGLRLLRMRERVAMVHGTFSIGTPAAGGTEIDIRIPLAGD